jgi:hypothetical protein
MAGYGACGSGAFPKRLDARAMNRVRNSWRALLVGVALVVLNAAAAAGAGDSATAGMPEDDRLHLAVAYFNTGQKAKAIQTFKAVRGSDGTADLARLWLIHAQRSSI